MAQRALRNILVLIGVMAASACTVHVSGSATSSPHSSSNGGQATKGKTRPDPQGRSNGSNSSNGAKTGDGGSNAGSGSGESNGNDESSSQPPPRRPQPEPGDNGQGPGRKPATPPSDDGKGPDCIPGEAKGHDKNKAKGQAKGHDLPKCEETELSEAPGRKGTASPANTEVRPQLSPGNSGKSVAKPAKKRTPPPKDDKSKVMKSPKP